MSHPLIHIFVEKKNRDKPYITYKEFDYVEYMTSDYIEDLIQTLQEILEKWDKKRESLELAEEASYRADRDQQELSDIEEDNFEYERDEWERYWEERSYRDM